VVYNYKLIKDIYPSIIYLKNYLGEFYGYCLLQYLTCYVRSLYFKDDAFQPFNIFYIIRFEEGHSRLCLNVLCQIYLKGFLRILNANLPQDIQISFQHKFDFLNRLIDHITTLSVTFTNYQDIDHLFNICILIAYDIYNTSDLFFPPLDKEKEKELGRLVIYMRVFNSEVNKYIDAWYILKDEILEENKKTGPTDMTPAQIAQSSQLFQPMIVKLNTTETGLLRLSKSPPKKSPGQNAGKIKTKKLQKRFKSRVKIVGAIYFGSIGKRKTSKQQKRFKSNKLRKGKMSVKRSRRQKI
jgi:hypothetical protein